MSMWKILASLVIAQALAASSAWAQAPGWCWDAAGAAQGVSPVLLRAIAAEESSCGAANFHRNSNASSDHGPMQINDSWLRDPRFLRLGVRVQDLYQPCTANYIASWVVATCYKQYGVTWRAVGCYNAKTYSKQVEYANKIYRRIQRYHATGAGIC